MATFKDKKCLFALLIGIEDSDGRFSGDIEGAPHSNLPTKKRSVLKPNSHHLADVAHRRAKQLGIEAPRCNDWTQIQPKEFLILNPPKDEDEIKCLTAQENPIHQACLAVTEKNKKNEEEEDKSTQWRTPEPWLRLHHAAACDSCKAALVNDGLALDHETLDARNSNLRPKTHCEMVSETFNDEEIEFTTDSLPELHSSLADPVVLRFADMPGPVTPEDVKKRLGSAKACVAVMCSKWEKSGKGFGSSTEEESEESDDDHDPDEDLRDDGCVSDGEGGLVRKDIPQNYGRLTDDISHEVGDTRGGFLGSFKAHNLHHWHLSDKQDIIGHVVNAFPKGVAASSGNKAAVTDSVKKCTQNLQA